MAHIASSSQFEGQSTTSPPYFDGTNYNYWKTRMQIYLVQDSSLMQAIKKEITLVDLEKMETWIVEERRHIEISAKTMNTLIYALCPEEFQPHINLQDRQRNMGQTKGNPRRYKLGKRNKNKFTCS